MNSNQVTFNITLDPIVKKRQSSVKKKLSAFCKPFLNKTTYLSPAKLAALTTDFLVQRSDFARPPASCTFSPGLKAGIPK
ncbi:hypothetical protein BpHYR1_010527 [Brachionus plicatilis]|uniref:Uncharacterized protein n=1 Tax=Brachionus plicatilis TaxID=10195 RepID=A0A3M7PPS8_BRAPC|nr:hypothetical protein BpHYR1_010527 [Brachionus plicatilis]